MRYPIYQINAFSKRSFGGNPACVVPLTAWPSDEQMLAIAKENAVSETAFYIEASGKIQLRWFTPEIEMDLCGHATLAAAHCLVTHRAFATRPLKFITKSGLILVNVNGDKYQLDMPSRPGPQATLPKNIEDALSIKPKEVYKARDYLLVYESQADIEALQIDLDLFNQINISPGGIIVTAPGDTHDFVSRYFTPQASILEDPATGSAHCTLVPYWAKRLQKRSFNAYQCSQRGGELWCEDNGDRVLVSGYAFTYFVGSFTLSV